MSRQGQREIFLDDCCFFQLMLIAPLQSLKDMDNSDDGSLGLYPPDDARTCDLILKIQTPILLFRGGEAINTQCEGLCVIKRSRTGPGLPYDRSVLAQQRRWQNRKIMIKALSRWAS